MILKKSILLLCIFTLHFSFNLYGLPLTNTQIEQYAKDLIDKIKTDSLDLNDKNDQQTAIDFVGTQIFTDTGEGTSPNVLNKIFQEAVKQSTDKKEKILANGLKKLHIEENQQTKKAKSRRKNNRR